MTRQAAVREITLFLALTYALALGVAVALPHANINKLFSVLVPTISVVVLTFVATPSGRRRLLWRGVGLGRSGHTGRSAWLPALLVPMILLLLAYGAALALGVAELRDLTITTSTTVNWSINFGISLLIGTLIILGEEIGWRGFLLPRMQRLTSKRRAAVATGFCHGVFHLPLILLATTYDAEGSRWVVAPVAVVTVTAAGVFYAYLRDLSGSVWPVAFAHNAANTAFDLGAAATVATG
ncbi:MAG: hypothetical protein JWO11_2523, partial [Nocardioides sp.]|nr:hypothetical protein [Nocardioides sp.]